MEKEKLQNIWWFLEQNTGSDRGPIIEGKGQVWEGEKEHIFEKGRIHEGEEWGAEGMENEKGIENPMWGGIVYKEKDRKLRERAEWMGAKEV